MLKKLLFISGISLSATQLHAQALPKTDTTEEAGAPDTAIIAPKTLPRELQPVEVRAVRATKDAPFARTDLKKADIERANLGQDLPVLLQFTPSAVINTDAGAGVGYTGIRIRGTDPTRINVTFNGMPVNDPEEQSTFFVDIPDIASSTSSIQIQRGVGTSTNGAGAFGGTISISNLQQMDTAGVIYSGSYGTFNTFKNTLAAGTGMLKGGWQFDVRLSKITSDGYIQRSASDLKSMQFTAGYTPNDRTAFHFLFMPGTEKTGQAWNGVPQDSLATNRRHNELGMRADGTYYNNQTDNYMQNYYQFFADHKFGRSVTAHGGLFLTRGKGYYEEYRTSQAYADYKLPDVISPKGDTTTQTDLIRRLWLDNYYYGGVFSLQYSAPRTQVTLGGGWSQFQNLSYGNVVYALSGGVPDNYKWYQTDAQKNDLNIYLKAEHKVGEVTLYADMQYRNVAYFMNGFRRNPGLQPAVNYDFYNPKAGLSWLLSNADRNRQRLYASVAVGNREPNRGAFETSPQRLPRPERMYDGEAGYEATGNKWTASANLYYMNYHNQLVLTGQINDVGAYVQTNVAESYRAGIELQAGITATRWLRLAGNATFSRNKINNFNEYIDNYDSTAQRVNAYRTTDIAFSPNVIAAGTVTFIPLQGKKGGTLEIDLSNKYVGRQYLDNTTNADRAIKEYNYLNLLIRYTVKVKPFKEVVATLALNNITGALYANNGYTFSYVYGGSLTTQNYYFPQAGFNVLGGLTFKW